MALDSAINGIFISMISETDKLLTLNANRYAKTYIHISMLMEITVNKYLFAIDFVMGVMLSPDNQY